VFKKLVLLLLLTISIKAQISDYSPLTPIQTNKVVISYNPFIDSAQFSINDEVYAIIWQYHIDGEYSSTYQKLTPEKNILTCKIIVDSSAALYTIHFITLSTNSWDAKADLKFMVYGQNGKPVMNAHCANMNFDNYESESKAELLLYPANYSVYNTIWSNYKMQKPEEFNSLVSNDLLKLGEVKENSLQLLYAQVYGNILLHKFDDAIQLCHKFVAYYSRHSFAIITLTSLLKELESTNDKGDNYKQIKKMIEKYALENNDLQTVWDIVVSQSFYIYSDSCIQKVCESWISKQPENPTPYYFAGIISNQRSELLKAEQYFKKAITLILQGKLRLYSDISGKSSRDYLAGLYYFLSDIKYQQKEFGEALEAIKTSETILDNPYHKLFQLEGDIWYALKDYVRAEKSYLEALKKGLGEAKIGLQNCYGKTHNNLDGFDSYLSSQINQGTTNKKEEERKAPAFNINDIKGANYSLDKLKGKVVVVNFWFTGCRPCRQEIPVLNELVNKYKSEDVKFISFALDNDIKILRSFLKINPFNYIIIPNSSKVAEDYKIKMYPSHIIIDKKGNIVATIEGGYDKINKELSTIIDNQLRN